MAFKNGDLVRGVIKNGKLEGDVLYIDKAKRTVTHLKYQNGVQIDQ
jgi:antitoxin component YwqK of YwqJK toxin-antitoxin module